MPDADIKQLLHRIKSPITLLGAYFSVLEEKTSPEEILAYVKQYSTPCKSAVQEISRIIETLSGHE